jgi:hypothetical protein
MARRRYCLHRLINLSPVAFAVDDAINGAHASFVMLPWDGELYLVPGEILANLPAAVPFVADDAIRSPILASWRWPGVRGKVMSLPPPCAHTCTFVLNPPRLRPNASSYGSLFLPQPRADAPGLWSHSRSAPPTRSCSPHRPGFAKMACRNQVCLDFSQ